MQAHLSMLHPSGMLHHRPLHLGGLLAGGVIGVCGDDDGGVASSTSSSCSWWGGFCGPTFLGWNARGFDGGLLRSWDWTTTRDC